MSWDSPTIRELCRVRAAYGLMQLVVPAWLLGMRDEPRAHKLVRILGARHIAQAALTAAAPTPTVIAVGAGVDLLHAGTMYAAAALSPRRRARPLADALVATGFAAWGGTASVTRRQPRGQ